MNLYFSRSINRWIADYRVGPRGRKVRRILRFKTRAQLDAHAASMADATTHAKAVLMAMSAEQQADLVQLLDEARDGAFTIRDAVMAFKSSGRAKPKEFTVKLCYDDFIAEKLRLKLAPKSLSALKSNVGRYVALSPDKPITLVTRESVMEYLSNPEWSARTYNSYAISIKAFFAWCVACERLAKSPAATVPLIKRSQMPDLDKPPVILDDDQLQRLLLAAYYHDPAMLHPIIFGAFAGLRPEIEARRIHKDDFQGGQLLVRGAHAKDRTRRFVDVNPTLKAWLDLCPKLKGIPNFRRRFDLVRLQAGLIKVKAVKGKQRIRVNKNKTGKKKDGRWTGYVVKWTGWGQDCLRHTFASNYLPIHGVDKTIEQLGHSDYDQLFGHYRNLRSKAESEAFWKRFTDLAKELAGGRGDRARSEIPCV